MAKAATHFGTCQLCGRQQKLPGGRLAKHGYAIEWSMFVGVCPGSDGLPFEQSTDLIQAAIDRAKGWNVSLNAQANELETNENPDTVWVHEYRKPHWQGGRAVRSSYVWRQIPVAHIEVVRREMSAASILYEAFYVHSRSGQKVRLFSDAGFVRNVTEGYRKLNATKAIQLRREIVDNERYIKWQQERIANWSPRELTPIVA